MKRRSYLCLVLIMVSGLHSIKAYASWDPYENLRIALGNWTPTPIFRIESTEILDQKFIYIKGDATQIFLELEQKKAELLILRARLSNLKTASRLVAFKLWKMQTALPQVQ